MKMTFQLKNLWNCFFKRIFFIAYMLGYYKQIDLTLMRENLQYICETKIQSKN